MYSPVLNVEETGKRSRLAINISLRGSETRVCEPINKMRACEIKSRDAVGGLGVSQKIFARLFGNQARVLEFKVSALNLAFVHGEFLRQHGR